MERVEIAAGGVRAAIAARGAELQSLRGPDGLERLWTGDPAWWPFHAPLLFPVIGELNGGVLRVGDLAFPMGRHGFARFRAFNLVGAGSDWALFRLEDDAETRAAYPFSFRLDVRWAVEDAGVLASIELVNPGAAPLAASVGLHPALAWPPPGEARAGAEVRFEADEPAPVRRLTPAGLVSAEPRPTPVRGRRLALEDALFTDDALIFDALRSRAATFVCGGRRLRIEFPDASVLGVWTKPGAPFICVEPWRGLADPDGFEGDLFDKPGVVRLEPGGSLVFRVRLQILA